ncbi:MAG TPA: trypsin-like peptidase domain-containing protein [Kineosporiaceae bacterium]|nr:trypsin-like peptidase domain-containing protein [Kineosporiaceae bacterium]
MTNTQEPLTADPEPSRSWFSGPVGRHRRTALVASTALALVVTVGGAARAEQGTSASYLQTDTATVASSVKGALVDIVSTDGYQGAVSAGTGMVLTSTGEILTNNHVIEGATRIKVTVVSTQKTYTAKVVGTDPTADVAVIQLVNASGLKTLPIGDSSAVKIGQSVVASGNAGGDGGEPSVVTGTVTALDQDITASSEGAQAEQLTGLIETSAPVVAGDSGGALATTAGKVIGMNTAASVSNSTGRMASASTATTTAAQSYAIPIATALSIAHQIDTGQASSTIHIGLHGFLGVALADESVSAGRVYGRFGGYADQDQLGESSSGTTSGVTVGGIVSAGPAEASGLQAGDIITAVNGTTVDSATTLNSIMAATKPGQKVTVNWTDASGQAQTATITLGTAAAD